jgi:membrane associated rhomboid family serine protease
MSLNTLVLAATYIHPSNSDPVFGRYGFIPAHPHLSTLLSSMFLHAGFWHFAGNMFFLWMFGYRVENTFSRVCTIA